MESDRNYEVGQNKGVLLLLHWRSGWEGPVKFVKGGGYMLY